MASIVMPGTSAIPRRRTLAATGAALTLAIVAAAMPGRADDQSQYKVVDGIGVYYGIVPAAIVRGHSKAHTEGAMHGGAPQGNEVHLVVALFDAASSARIENAKVTARISPLGAGGPSRALKTMSIAGTVSYGEFFPLAPGDRYMIHIEIDRPGSGRTTTVDFVYDDGRS
jgi:hypothetical protein